MGCYDGAEVCELVGIFILNKLSHIKDNNSFHLYRDNGLAVFDKLSEPKIEQRKIKIINIFKDCGLSTRVTSYTTSVDFLNITVNLKTESSQQFRKPNNDQNNLKLNIPLDPKVSNGGNKVHT